MTNSRPLTLATLGKKGACSDQLALFRELFGDSVEITEKLAAEHAEKFYVGWAANNLLSPKARDAYEAATAPDLAAYTAATEQARAAFAAAEAQAWAAYKAAKAQAAYEAARAEAQAAYDAAKAQSLAAYYAATAQAWTRAYINDGGKK